MKKMKQKSVGQLIIIGLIISTIITLVLDYLIPTPWNIRSEGTWIKLFFVVMIYCTIHALILGVAQAKYIIPKNDKLVNLPFIIPTIMVPVFFVCLVSGAQIFHAPAYSQIIQVEQVASGDAILSEKDAESIALMDTASAKQLGDREIGAIENFSAFNVSDDYIQLNIKEDAVKVSPLEYIGLFKWFSNREEGVTGYVSVSPTTMTADYVKLEEGMKYIPSAYFHEDLNRHLHYQFPTLIYGNIHFEVDEEGKPYYVATVFDKTIGLFGGKIVVGAIITDPVTGESEYYDVVDIPQWVDYVFPGDLICSLYNIAYKNINGFWNGTSFGANTGCMQTTTIDSYYEDEDGDTVVEAGTDYGYIAKDGDIYVYTGVTSMAADSSNLGFIMVNERTGEYKYFAVSSANEQSAMNAAEGEVQQYGYQASFPTLINVSNELAYIGVLKDQSGLVKMYYMVNVKDYGKVVVADSRESCVIKYAEKLGLDLEGEIAGSETEQESVETIPVEFTITVMQYVDVNGNTYVYMGTEDGSVYKALFSTNEQLLFAKVGDVVKGILINGELKVESISTPIPLEI